MRIAEIQAPLAVDDEQVKRDLAALKKLLEVGPSELMRHLLLRVAQCYLSSSVPGEVAEWLMAHAWKACLG